MIERPMTFDIFYWVQAIARWTHVFAAILWIGQTFLFHHLERNLRRAATGDDRALGELWMVHGGGFYRLEKQRFATPIPERLLWFRWEAAATWISGVVLIALTYYAGGLLVEPEQSWGRAALVGAGSLIVGWLLYDGLVRTRLGDHPAFAVLGLAALAGAHWGFLQVMGSRAALVHVGAMIGTVMAANVWMRILPAQRRMLAAVEAGTAIDDRLARVGPQRSKHNSHLVVPLVFLMLANHYPTLTYGHSHATVVMVVILALGWGVAHWLLRR